MFAKLLIHMRSSDKKTRTIMHMYVTHAVNIWNHIYVRLPSSWPDPEIPQDETTIMSQVGEKATRDLIALNSHCSFITFFFLAWL